MEPALSRRYTMLAYVPSWHCDQHCRHCFVPVRERRRDRHVRAVAGALLAGLPADVETVSISGGEPFLHLQRLTQLVQLVRASSRGAHVVTGGGWLRDSGQIERVIERLARAGLTRLALSLDPYRSPAVPAELIRHLLHAASGYGIELELKAVGSDASIADDVHGWLNTVGVSAVVRSSVYREFVRTAGERVGDTAEAPSGSPCDGLDVPAVTPLGQVYACCSAHVFELAGTPLDLGNLMRTPLDSLLVSAGRDPLLGAIRAGGPVWLLDALEMSAKGAHWRTPCEACSYLIRDPGRVRKARQALATNTRLRKHVAAFELLGQARKT